MKTNILVGLIGIIFLININLCSAQSDKPEKGDIYKVETNLKNSLRDFNIDGDVCGVNKYSAQENTLLKIVKLLDSTTVVVKAYKAFNPQNGITNEIIRNETYCMSIDKLTYTHLQNQTESGFLAVPFKMRIKPVNVYFGGNIGYFVGHRFDKRKTPKTLLGFAGLSTVELNDINSDVPQTKIGVTLGGGYVWKLRDDFQIGIITGVDLFDGVEKWAYGFQPWIAFGIGFKFTSKSSSNTSPLIQTLQ